MITAIVFDVDDTIYDQQAPYRIAMEKCFPDFDMSVMNQAYIRFRHYSDVGFPRVMAGSGPQNISDSGVARKHCLSLAIEKSTKLREYIFKKSMSTNLRTLPC